MADVLMSDVPKSAVSREGRTIFALTFVVLVYALMQTILVPALPLLGKDLHADLSLSGWILTAYLLAGAVLTPIAGSFGDRYGHRRVLIVVLSVFLLATVAAAFAPDIGVLIAARAVQGISAAAFPLALAIVRRHLTGNAMGRGIGWIAGILGLGAGAALVIGGLILELTSWQGIFVVVAVLIAVSLVFVVLWVPQSARGEHTPTDYVGAALLTVMLVSGLLAITQGSSWGWGSPRSVVLITVAVVSLVVLVIVERRMRAPLIDVRSLARPSLAIAHVLALANGFVSYLLYLGIPAILEADPATGYGHGFDVLTTGLVLLPSAVFVFTGGRAAPVFVRLIGARLSLIAAMALMGIGSLVLIIRPSQLWSIMISFSIVSLGIGGGFSLLSQIIVRVAPADEVAAAGGLNSMMRSVGQATGSPVAAVVLSAGVTGALIPIGNYQHAFAVAAISALLAAALGIGLKLPSDQDAG